MCDAMSDRMLSVHMHTLLCQLATTHASNGISSSLVHGSHGQLAAGIQANQTYVHCACPATLVSALRTAPQAAGCTGHALIAEQDRAHTVERH